MKYLYLFRLLIVLLIFTLFFSFLPNPSHADVLSVTANGANSTTNSSLNTNTSAAVQQSNTANVSDDISVTSNTGNNSADNSSGSVNVTTGNITTDSNVTNNLNTSNVDQACCLSPAPQTVVISGNGEDSENISSLNSTNSSTNKVTQNAVIKSNITINASTGNNTASDNTGNVTIKTGDIKSSQNIQTHANSTQVSPKSKSNNPTDISIAGNGIDSNNRTSIDKNENTKNIIDNKSDIINNIKSIFTTGNNHAGGNIGNVDIQTGNIISDININNSANSNAPCCSPENSPPDPSEEPHPQPTPPIPPIQSAPMPLASTAASSGPPGDPQIGQVAGVAARLLPATGTSWLFFALIGNIMMFFLGASLRLYSGNAPGAVL